MTLVTGTTQASGFVSPLVTGRPSDGEAVVTREGPEGVIQQVHADSVLATFCRALQVSSTTRL